MVQVCVDRSSDSIDSKFSPGGQVERVGNHDLIAVARINAVPQAGKSGACLRPVGKPRPCAVNTDVGSSTRNHSL